MIIESNSVFFFYFCPDPDAVGASVALALYLVRENKECIIFLPDGVDQNLDFILDIAKYNNIFILSEPNEVLNILKAKKPIFITCDTPTHFLLENFEKINSLKDASENNVSIEIDHHFGGDSEKIYKDSIAFFQTANSSCEIVADLLEMLNLDDPGNIEADFDITFPRNIVLSLLVGICFDTQFGKYITSKENYHRWFHLLSERLKWLTWGNPKYIRSSMQVYDAINRMSKAKSKIIKGLVKTSNIINNVGLLIVPPYGMYESISSSGDSTCILSKLVPDLSNRVPEYSGRVGILGYFDDVSELYFLKIRRSERFKKYDLRKAEKILADIFNEKFKGGGGHQGATSFRIENMTRSEFIKHINDFHNILSDTIDESLKSIKKNK